MKTLIHLSITVGLFTVTQALNAQWTGTNPVTLTGNAGIGVTNPSARLEIANSGNASLRVGVSSNMANTHTQLINSLAVIGDNSSTIATNAAGAWDFYNNGNNPSWSGAMLQHMGTAIGGNLYGLPASNLGTVLFQNVSNGVIASNGANIYISPAGVVSTSFLTNGNVGIGTSDTKGYKFAVNGDAIFTRIKVKSYANWPDFVFHSSYRLRPLNEVEQYIQQNHHLPEMPSAEEVEKNGLDLSDNQALLLKKIEELTLYVIEQNKTNEQQRKLLAEQQEALNRQQKQIDALEKQVAPNKTK